MEKKIVLLTMICQQSAKNWRQVELKTCGANLNLQTKFGVKRIQFSLTLTSLTLVINRRRKGINFSLFDTQVVLFYFIQEKRKMVKTQTEPATLRRKMAEFR